MSRNILIMLALFVLALGGAVYGIQYWADNQIRLGLKEITDHDNEVFERGRARLIRVGARAVPYLIDAVESVNPHTHERAIDADQLFWRGVTVLGDIGDPAAVEPLRGWLREDELDGFQAGAEALLQISLRHPDHPEAALALDDISDAMEKTRRAGNVKYALSLLDEHGLAPHAETIQRVLKRNAHDDVTLQDYLRALEKIAARGVRYDVGILREHPLWEVRVRLGRILCYQGQEEGVDVLADILRRVDEVDDFMTICLAGIGFDMFTDRNLNTTVNDSEALLREKAGVYLKFYDESKAEGKAMLRPYRP